jgi:oligopeptide transport system substrate-binding protein
MNNFSGNKHCPYRLKFVAILFLPFILFSICACTNTSDKLNRKVFRYNESKGITSLDPAFAKSQALFWAVGQLFNGLTQMDTDLRVQPCIARKWEVSADGRCYTFHLRTDVCFHNHPLFPRGKGRKVIASDFIYSFNRITNPKIASPGAWIFNLLDRNAANNFSGCKAINDSTLEIQLSKPFPAFPGLLTMCYCSVIPHEIADYYGEDFRNHPVGTGPFQFKLWKEGEKLVFVKNPNYFEQDENGKYLPYLDAIAITFISDKQSEFLEFVKGNLDFLQGVNAANKDELITHNGKLNAKYADRFTMLALPYLNTEYFGFQFDTAQSDAVKKVLSKKEIRQAINYGFDRTKLVAYLRNNLGTPATHGFIPPGMPSFTDTLMGYNYNPDKSRQLLAQAGYPNGKGLPEITLYTLGEYLDVAEFIQNQLAQVGITINIDVNTVAKYRQMMAAAKLSFFRATWIADYPDAENYLALFYSHNFCPSGPNYTHFHNAEYDKLYESSFREANDSIRFGIYRKLDQMIIDEAAIVPVFYDKVVYFCPKNIKSLKVNSMNLLMIKFLQKNN